MTQVLNYYVEQQFSITKEYPMFLYVKASSFVSIDIRCRRMKATYIKIELSTKKFPKKQY